VFYQIGFGTLNLINQNVSRLRLFLHIIFQIIWNNNIKEASDTGCNGAGLGICPKMHTWVLARLLVNE
jgi:hypothetical protein